MLENISKEVLASYVVTPVTATSTSFVDSGIALQLAPNSVYHVTFVGYWDYDTDGIRYSVNYSGTLSQDRLYFTREDGSSGQGTANSAVPELTLNAETTRCEGLLVTSTAGKLYVEFCKYFDFGTDSTIKAGSYLVARRV